MVDRETGRMLRFLAKDPFVRVAAGLLLTTMVIFLFRNPFLRDLIVDTNYPADLVWLLLLLVALRYGRKRVAAPEERAFWTLLCFATAAWAVVAFFFTLFPLFEEHPIFSVTADFLYLVFFGLFLAATELDPDRESGRLLQDAELRLVGIAGPLIMGISLYSYLIIIPAIVDPSWYADGVPSNLLIVVFDFYLAIRLLRMTQSARTRRWNVHYGLFALIFYLWGLIEANDLVNMTRALPMVSGPVLDFLWFLPFPVAVTAVRLRHWGPAEGSERVRRLPASAVPKRRRYEWSLAAMAVLLPAVHFGSYGLGLMRGEDTQVPHELTVLVYVVAVGVLELTANRMRALMAPLRERAEHAQRMEAIGVLAGGIAHDFNNILTIVLGHGQLLQRTLPAGDTRRHRVEEIIKAGRRAAGLAGGLLAFARREHSEPIRLDLNTVIAELTPLLRSLLTDDIRLWIDYQPDLPAVLIDQSQIEQVIVNLVTNARDALPTGGDLYLSTREVKGSRRSRRVGDPVPPGRWVMLEIRDTGTGMSAEVRDRAFEPFFTTKPRAKGTGLGLAVVYGIVRQNGGEIHLESAPEEGACFRVFLPPVTPESPVRPEGPMPEPAGRITGRVLVAEDDPAVRSLVRQILGEAGFEVVTAANGRRALDELHRAGAHFDLVLTDVLMPEVGGVELAREVAATDPSCQVLFMSGYADESLVYRLTVEPGVRLLTKPFTPDQLLREVRRILSLEEHG